MPSRLLAASLLLLAACSPAEEAAAPQPGRRGDLTVRMRPLRSDSALAAVGLAPEGDRRAGAATWDSAFAAAPGRPLRDAIARDFRLIITNRAATAREFHARIDCRAADGILVRRRTLASLVVPPFTEALWEGTLLLPRPGDAPVVARVLPADEPFEAEP